MISRRRWLFGAGAAAAGGTAFVMRKKLASKLRGWTRSSEFAATPALVPHRPDEARTIWVAKGGEVAANVDRVLDGAGLARIVGATDIVLVKVSAQWWNQGMTNAAAAKRVIERILAVPGFAGEVVVFENTHFRLPDGSGLARAFTRPSERNVDVPGWKSLGDLVTHFTASGAPVSFVGLIDAAPSELAGDGWHDPAHDHGVYGGDGRGPIADGEARDGMRWDFARAFTKKRGWFEDAKTPLSWPVFTSPRSGLRIDLADGVFDKAGARVTDRKLTWISLVTANEHGATGMTCCCKSAMGILDMSAGKLGLDPRSAGYSSVHYFGTPDAQWRMAGPLAHFAKHVRAPDLYVAVAEWIGLSPAAGVAGGWDDETSDLRLDERTAHRANTIVAGVDPVAIDFHVAKHVLTPIAERVGARDRAQFDVRDPDAKLSKFLRYYREVWGQGTLDESLVTVREA